MLVSVATQTKGARYACLVCPCCAAMFMSGGEDGTVRQVDLRENARTMTLIGEPGFK